MLPLFFAVRLINLPALCPFILALLDNLNSATTPQQKYGVLSLVSALGAIILDNKGTFKDEIEQFVGRFVVPELSSGHAYLRYVVRTLSN